jgi:hypothetical protein
MCISVYLCLYTCVCQLHTFITLASSSPSVVPGSTLAAPGVFLSPIAGVKVRFDDLGSPSMHELPEVVTVMMSVCNSCDVRE